MSKQPPNVIFVLTDDQGYGDLSCHGNPVIQTPCIDRLQAQSVRFTDFHVAPVCTPTRGELMTGLDALHGTAAPDLERMAVIQFGHPNEGVLCHTERGMWTSRGKDSTSSRSADGPKSRGWALRIPHP